MSAEGPGGIPSPSAATRSSTRDEPLLSVRGLAVEFATARGPLPAVRGVSFDVHEGEVLGIIGESGCGKSTTALALLGLLDRPAGRIGGGRAMWKGRDLLSLPETEMRRIRGKEIAMVFQDSLSALHPALPVVDQVVEALHTHSPSLERRFAREHARAALLAVGIPAEALEERAYPHQWSGGMRQRAMLAMAMVNEPRLLIADEPTTALDVTVQAQILEVLAGRMRREAATILITHDLAVIAELADRVAVMYAGRIVETGTAHHVFAAPRHPYTVALLDSRPGVARPSRRLLAGAPPDPRELPSGCEFEPRCYLSRGRVRCRLERPGLEDAGPRGQRAACHFPPEILVASPAAEPSPPRSPSGGGADAEATVPTEQELAALERATRTEPALRAEAVSVAYRDGSGRRVREFRAVDGVSLEIGGGETLGLVGESGCGKSTLARALVGLEPLAGGRVLLGSRVVLAGPAAEPARNSDEPQAEEAESARLHRDVQIVFQDPYASLNPRRTVGGIVAQPLRIHGRFRRRGGPARVAELLELVGLSAADADRHPHQLSGGQRQRVAIARALAVEPHVLILDEPVTSLDMAVRTQILALLERLKNELGLAMLLIAHDLAVVRQVAERVAVMYLGRIAEAGPTEALFAAPTHPYTKALLSAIPASDPRRRSPGRRIVLEGEVPHPSNPPSGCRFRTRCWKASVRCGAETPDLETRGMGRVSACFHPES